MPNLNQNPEVWIGALTILLGAFSLINARFLAYLQKQRTQRDRVFDLFSEFYSADTYRRMVAPVFQLMLKWRGLPNQERNAYREAVRLGWTGAVSQPKELLEAHVAPERLKKPPNEVHFQTTKESGSFTEHESLTAFLYFWTKVDTMITTGMICPKVSRQLFAGPYDYYRSFIGELRNEIAPYVDQSTAPAWINATTHLDNFFNIPKK